MSRGYVLMEVTVAYVILAFAIVSLVPAFVLAIKANKNTEQIQTATDLAQELLEEIRMRRWDENTPFPRTTYITAPSSTLGPEAGETDKTLFDDIDDFNGWTESSVKDPLNNAVAAFAGFSRSVTVQYVDSSLAASAGTTDYKKVTVCAQNSKIQPVCLSTIFTNR